jgi:hypothetical protein
MTSHTPLSAIVKQPARAGAGSGRVTRNAHRESMAGDADLSEKKKVDCYDGWICSAVMQETARRYDLAITPVACGKLPGWRKAI